MKVKGKSVIALLLGAMFLLVHGCSSTARIQESELLELRGSPNITAVHYSPSLFMLVLPETSVRTGLGFAFGSFGSGMSAGVSVGGDKESRPAPELAAQFSLQDPAMRVKDSFTARLERELGFRNIRSENEALAEDDVKAAEERFGPGAVIDFRTTHWALASYTRKHVYYHTPLKIRARIIGPEGSVIWKAACSYKAEKGKDSPTFEAATAEGGALLKRMLSDAADYCAQELFLKLKDFK